MKYRIYILIFIIFILSACFPKPSDIETVSPTLIVSTSKTESAQYIETSTPVPLTETPMPPTATLTKTSTVTVTPSPTSSAQLDKVKIIGGDYYGDNSVIYIDIPGLDMNYRIVINDFEYQCELTEAVPDRLICYGKFLDNQKSKDADLKIYSLITEELLHQTIAYVPMTIPTELPIGAASTWCPLRGTNITCETEWRTENDQICIVKSCFDACGYYYSEHTCTQDPNNNAIIQPTPTPF